MIGDQPNGPDGADVQDRMRMHLPHSARICNYWLGGKDHWPPDRDTAQQVMQIRPEAVATALANRYFLARAVRHLVNHCAIRQFLDIGAGLPVPEHTHENTHEIAQREVPGCRIVYADNDPMVLAHARALLRSGPEGACGYVDADLRDPAQVLAGAEETLDLSQPVAVLLLAVLPLISNDDDPAGLVAALAALLPPGSYLAISHLTADFAPQLVREAVQAYNAAVPEPVTARTYDEITALLGGLPLLRPGLVTAADWRPELSDPRPNPADLYTAVARIPHEHR